MSTKRVILTAIAVIIGICPMVIFMTRGAVNWVMTSLCIICAIITMVYAHSAKGSLLHRFAEWTLLSIGAYLVSLVYSSSIGMKAERKPLKSSRDKAVLSLFGQSTGIMS